MNLCIDIETIACSSIGRLKYLADHLKPPANYKTDTAIDKWRLTAKEKMIENTSFDGSSGEIITIGYAVGNEPAKVLQRDDTTSERKIIQEFFDDLKVVCEKNNISSSYSPFTWIAHNAAFDLPFLFKRCVINSLNINTHGIAIPHNQRHGNGKVFCTMTEWMGFGAKAGGSLDNICNALGMDGKGDFDGSMVGAAFENGEFKKIADYCLSDVANTLEIYNRFKAVSHGV